MVGKRSIMEKRTDTHMAATFHGDLLSVVAAMTVIKVMRQRDGIGYFWRIGRRLIDGLNRAVQEAEAPVKMVGFPPMPVVQATDDDDAVPCPKDLRDEACKQFCAALQRRGIYATPHPWFLSLAHTEQEIDHTIDVAFDAAREMREVMAGVAAKK